jgi:hypothetical protein
MSYEVAKKHAFILRSSILLATVSVMVSCGASQPESTSPRYYSDDVEGTTHANDKVTPTREYYDALLADRMTVADANGFQGSKVVYVSFNGADVKKGLGRGESFITCQDVATVPASGFSGSEQKSILEKVALYYSNAGAKVDFTTSEPESGDYTTVHVGGIADLLGCKTVSAIGMAPFDVKNANPNDVVFAFVPKNRDVTLVAKIIAHETAHSFGIDHSDNELDIMYPTVSGSSTGFDIGVAEGTGSEQNASELLQRTVGSGASSVNGKIIEATNPNVVILPVLSSPVSSLFPNVPGSIPNLGSIPGLENLGALGQLIGQLSPQLISLLGSKLPALGQLPGGINLQNPQSIMALLTILQNVISKQNGGTFDIQALSGLIVNPQMKQLVSALIVVGLNGANPGAAAATLIPIVIPMITKAVTGGSTTVNIDITKLMGITDLKNPADIIALIEPFVQMINANASGSNAQAMLDIVKMALAAQYLKI